MLITWTDEVGAPAGLFIAFSKYEERGQLKSAGWRWNPVTKRWFTSDLDRARQFEPYMDEAARARLATASDAAVSQMAASRAEEAAIDVPAPPGLTYLPYQLAGIAYALKRRDTLIADEMGLGKTIQALGIVNVLRPARALVVCPASLRLNWRTEARRWLVGAVRAVIVTDTWWDGITSSGLLDTADSIMVILSYEGVLKHKRMIDATRWGLAIFDEAHYLKNGAAKRTKAIFGFQRENHPDHRRPIGAERRVFLTGTPIVNRPYELWPLVHAVDRAGLGANHKIYTERYVNAVEAIKSLEHRERELRTWLKTPGNDRYFHYFNSNMAEIQEKRRVLPADPLRELHDRLRSTFMVRRLKADVLKDLPPKRRQIILLDPEGMDDVLRAERELIAAKAKELAALKLTAAVSKLTAWRGVAMTEISRVRHETAVRKIPAVVDHMLTVLEETPRLVIFAHHHDVIDGLAAALPEATVTFDGRMKQEDRMAAVERFQTDPGCRVFVGSIGAAGLGITLTAASLVIFAELDWTPSRMVQAEDRLHRLGQHSPVHVQHLVVDGSIDQRMSQMLIDKAAVIDAVLDGKSSDQPDSESTMLDQLLAG